MTDDLIRDQRITAMGLLAEACSGLAARFSATAEIDREEFGITWNVALETGGVMVGKKIKLEIEGEAIRQV